MGQAKDQSIRESELNCQLGSSSNVCADCIEDSALAEVVRENLESETCDYCGQSSDVDIAAPLDAIIEHMADAIGQEYTDPANVLPYETADGGYLGTVIDGYDILDEIGFEVESEELFEDLQSAFTGGIWCRSDYYSLTPVERRKFGWDQFKQTVKHERRFTFWSMHTEDEFDRDDVPVGKMLAEIGSAIKTANLIKPIPIGSHFWRVRVHPRGCPFSHDHEISPPPPEKANQSNRMSPAGVSMFYGADDFKTAVAETVDSPRDGGKEVTGGCFKTIKVLNILDLVELPDAPSFFDLEGRHLRNTIAFLRQFAKDIAEPISKDGSEHVEYVPTQAFTEYMRFEFPSRHKVKVDGIRYRSSRNRRPCVVLFCGQRQCVVGKSGDDSDLMLELDVSSWKTEKIPSKR